MWKCFRLVYIHNSILLLLCCYLHVLRSFVHYFSIYRPRARFVDRFVYWFIEISVVNLQIFNQQLNVFVFPFSSNSCGCFYLLAISHIISIYDIDDWSLSDSRFTIVFIAVVVVVVVLFSFTNLYSQNRLTNECHVCVCVVYVW